jgi:uncharacterized protein (UPF0276 family)
MNKHSDYPNLGFGLGLRAPHYEEILEQRPDVGFLEIISENFLDQHPGYWDMLADLSDDYPLLMHGVSLSIGSTDPLNTKYLEKLKALAEHVQAAWLSDHLCYTGVQNMNTHDLLPVPCTEEALFHIVPRIREVQDRLERQFVMENPSTYLQFAASSMPEEEFLVRIAEEADCKILLDVNNVYVNSINHGFDPYTYLDAIPADRIAQVHLAGHKRYPTHAIDTHDCPVPEEVWLLYCHLIRTKGRFTTLIEWDENIPPFSTLLEEMWLARFLADSSIEKEPQYA